MWTSWKISAKGLCAHNCNCNCNCTTAIPPQQWNEWLRKDSMKTSICYITVTVTWQTQPQQHQHVTARGVEVWVCGGTVLNGWLSGRISSVQYMQYILLLFRLLLLRCAVYVCSACARWKEWKLVNTGYAALLWCCWLLWLINVQQYRYDMVLRRSLGNSGNLYWITIWQWSSYTKQTSSTLSLLFRRC